MLLSIDIIDLCNGDALCFFVTKYVLPVVIK
jgi:hypothetical protein